MCSTVQNDVAYATIPFGGCPKNKSKEMSLPYIHAMSCFASLICVAFLQSYLIADSKFSWEGLLHEAISEPEAHMVPQLWNECIRFLFFCRKIRK